MRAWIRAIWQRVQAALQAHLSPGEIGRAVGIGLLIGCLPLYGIHLPLCYAVGRVVKLNMALAYMAANISNPLFAPVLIVLQAALGGWLRTGRWVEVKLEGSVWDIASQAPDVFVSYLLGSVVSAVVLGGLGGAIAWGIATLRLRRQGG